MFPKDSRYELKSRSTFEMWTALLGMYSERKPVSACFVTQIMKKPEESGMSHRAKMNIHVVFWKHLHIHLKISVRAFTPSSSFRSIWSEEIQVLTYKQCVSRLGQESYLWQLGDKKGLLFWQQWFIQLASLHSLSRQSLELLFSVRQAHGEKLLLITQQLLQSIRDLRDARTSATMTQGCKPQCICTSLKLRRLHPPQDTIEVKRKLMRIYFAYICKPLIPFPSQMMLQVTTLREARDSQPNDGTGDYLERG
jgi:hypothetical protein